MSNWIIVTHMNSDLWQWRFKLAMVSIMKRTLSLREALMRDEESKLHPSQNPLWAGVCFDSLLPCAWCPELDIKANKPDKFNKSTSMFSRLKIESPLSLVRSKAMWGGGKRSKDCTLTTQPNITVVYKPEELLKPTVCSVWQVKQMLGGNGSLDAHWVSSGSFYTGKTNRLYTRWSMLRIKLPSPTIRPKQTC